MTKNYVTKDSGKREEFSTGAVRDTQTEKGRYDLMSPFAVRRIVGVYERGAKKYAERNWEKGMPISRCLDSAIRHIYQYMEGKEDEDHIAQASWNLCAIMHYEEMIERGILPKELNNLPDYRYRDTGKNSAEQSSV